MELLVKSMESILAEKEAALTKERQAIENLSTVLKRMGYGIVALSQLPPGQKRLGRPPRNQSEPAPASAEGTPRRRGRPPKSASAPQLVVDQPKKRRGRPPKARPESA